MDLGNLPIYGCLTGYPAYLQEVSAEQSDLYSYCYPRHDLDAGRPLLLRQSTVRLLDERLVRLDS